MIIPFVAEGEYTESGTCCELNRRRDCGHRYLSITNC